MSYDLAIIGGGPAGVAAGVYASRKRLKTVFITKDFGGQSSVSEEVQNWIGTTKISGIDLAQNLKNHLLAYAGDVVDVKEGETCDSISKNKDGFVVKTKTGTYEVKTILITTGSHRRKLTVPGAEEFENKGITYCASCDGPLFADQDVAIVGGGNAAFDSAAQLLAYCKSVTLLNRSDDFRADPATVKKVLSNPKMHAVTNAQLVKIVGNKFVTGLTYKNAESGEMKDLAVTGIFAEIGSLPTTEFAKSLVKIDEYNRIVVDPRTQMTSLAGIWAAGDCTDGLYHQNNIAAGDAVKALENLYLCLHAK
ncbi:MAG TPA: FAD-dependent oxidoreductase [Candidatus Paceibacterota bacterium]|nr:FAD-dependent oxidoreductase [Candidatus Paceibacterota bacterium]